ncbi:MAG: hypothetical protein LBR44_08235 [Clostridiales Family XIII bacterium]|jgi:hypothetical protein|nr:hypothetical protein [Clostridiales Family XIII bacterium]
MQLKYLRAALCLAACLALLALTACRPGPAADDAGSGTIADAGPGQEGSAPASGEEEGQSAAVPDVDLDAAAAEYLAAMGADEIAARAQILEDYILGQQEQYGWRPGQITYKDDGYLMTVTFDSYADSHVAYGNWETAHEQLESQEEADTLAAELGSAACILAKTSDGYLLGAYVGVPADVDEADFGLAAARVGELEGAAASFANQHRDAWYAEEKELLLDIMHWGDAKFATGDAGAVAIGIQFPEGGSIPGMEGASEQEFQDKWQDYARLATLLLDADVEVAFLDAETAEAGSSFSAEKQSYISGLSAAYWERLGGGA